MTSKKRLRRRIRRLKAELADLYAMYWPAAEARDHCAKEHT